MRFYKEAYGLDVMAYMNTGLIMLTEGYAFVDAQTPKKGDVIYVTAAMRGSGTDHWAIVKDYSNGYITMFEQNVVWDGKAALNRQIKYPSDSYYLLTPVSLGAAPDPVLRGAEEETTARPTATKSTTTKPTTTKPTTTKPTTTKPTTTKPETTTEITTTAVSTTATTVVSTNQASTTAATVEHTTETAQQTTAKNSEEKTEKKSFLIPIGVSVAALVCVIVVVEIIVKKKTDK